MVFKPQPDPEVDSKARRSAGDRARNHGLLTYPPTVQGSHTIHDINLMPANMTPSYDRPEVRVAGRVRSLSEVDGHLCVVIADGSSSGHYAELQLIASLTWSEYLHPGDYILCDGTLHGTSPGIAATTLEVLSKAFRTNELQPDASPQTRAQHRQLDVLANQRQRQLLVSRAKAAQAIRSVLSDSQYLEIDTPILQTASRGRVASPLSTFLNAERTQVCLRPTPTLLKSMLGAGIDKVFELYRSFRDEPLDDSHVVEFSLVELYCAYADFNAMKPVAQQLIRQTALAVRGSLHIPCAGGTIDLGQEWPSVDVHDAISQAVGTKLKYDATHERLSAVAKDHGVSHPDDATRDDIALCLYEHLVEPNTIQPTFYTGFPASTSVMARSHRAEPALAEKWDLVIGGHEIGSAYTELVDPQEQRDRLAQAADSTSAYEHDYIDDEYLRLLEAGFPPCAGLVLGFERILMTVTATRSIHDVVPFSTITAGFTQEHTRP